METLFNVGIDMYTHDEKPPYGTFFDKNNSFEKVVGAEELAKRIGEGRTINLRDCPNLMMLDFDNKFSLNLYSAGLITIAYNLKDRGFKEPEIKEFIDKYSELASMKTTEYMTCEEALKILKDMGITPVVAYQSFSSTSEHEKFHIIIETEPVDKNNYDERRKYTDLFKTVFGSALDITAENVMFGTTKDKIVEVNKDHSVVKYSDLRDYCSKIPQEVYDQRYLQLLDMETQLEANLPEIRRLLNTYNYDPKQDQCYDYAYSIYSMVYSDELTESIDLASLHQQANISSPYLMGGFTELSNLKSITLPEGLKRINSSAFEYCQKLEEINIPDGVAEIGDSAFRGCQALKSITIPDSVTQIVSKYTFIGCDNLTIKCSRGSYAEEYAKEHNIPIEYIKSLEELRETYTQAIEKIEELIPQIEELCMYAEKAKENGVDVQEWTSSHSDSQGDRFRCCVDEHNKMKLNFDVNEGSISLTEDFLNILKEHIEELPIDELKYSIDTVGRLLDKFDTFEKDFYQYIFNNNKEKNKSKVNIGKE